MLQERLAHGLAVGRRGPARGRPGWSARRSGRHAAQPACVGQGGDLGFGGLHELAGTVQRRRALDRRSRARHGPWTTASARACASRQLLAELGCRRSACAASMEATTDCASACAAAATCQACSASLDHLGGHHVADRWPVPGARGNHRPGTAAGPPGVRRARRPCRRAGPVEGPGRRRAGRLPGIGPPARADVACASSTAPRSSAVLVRCRTDSSLTRAAAGPRRRPPPWSRRALAGPPGTPLDCG